MVELAGQAEVIPAQLVPCAHRIEHRAHHGELAAEREQAGPEAVQPGMAARAIGPAAADDADQVGGGFHLGHQAGSFDQGQHAPIGGGKNRGCQVDAAIAVIERGHAAADLRGRLQHPHRESGLLQTEGGAESGDAGADHENRFAASRERGAHIRLRHVGNTRPPRSIQRSAASAAERSCMPATLAANLELLKYTSILFIDRYIVKQ